jgi:predicted RNA binding protein YcfA (HicA-like mRNA interferase family)
VRARDVIRYLESLGFAQARQRGSHKFFRHPDGRTATVPDHRGEDLGRGVLAKIPSRRPVLTRGIPKLPGRPRPRKHVKQLRGGRVRGRLDNVPQELLYN